ncbi:MAG: molybdopterin converting factor subunit 1 [Hylemonella sp.]
MKVSIRYFASVREGLGKSGEQMQTDATNLAMLRDELISRGGMYAEVLARGRAIRVALNQVMSSEEALLLEGCEIAFFPPVTGG